MIHLLKDTQESKKPWKRFKKLTTLSRCIRKSRSISNSVKNATAINQQDIYYMERCKFQNHQHKHGKKSLLIS